MNADTQTELQAVPVGAGEPLAMDARRATARHPAAAAAKTTR
jgi:hypothetical protein